MKAVQQHRFGGPEELYVGDVRTPGRKEGEVLVKIRASALNRADILQRQGKYPPPAGESEILGLEMAGDVVESDRTSEWKRGDKVMALLPGGGQAEYVSVQEELLMPIPEGLSYNDAAAIPEVFLTAYQALFFEGKIKAGQKALIHAGASGVGTAAIQLAKIEEVDTIVTCSRVKHKACLKLGASMAIDYQSENFRERVLESTDGKGVDIILDFIGEPNFKSNIESLAMSGKLVLIATMGGFKVNEVNLSTIMRKHVVIIGTTLRSRPLEYKADLIKSFSDDYLDSFSTGELQPVIDSIYSLDQIGYAHRLMESNKNIGKIIIEI